MTSDERVLALTSTSFADVNGPHHIALQVLCKQYNLRIAPARGPLDEAQLSRFLATNKPWCGIFGKDAFTAANVELFSSLGGEFISMYGVGTDNCDLDALAKMGVSLTNTRGSNHRAVAEMALALMLAGLRRVVEQSLKISEHRIWVRPTGSELTGKTALLIGFGRVGQQVAFSLICQGVNVLIYEPYFNQSHVAIVNKLAAWAEELYLDFGNPNCRIGTVSQIDDALPKVDIISLHAPLTEETRGIINEASIAQTKKSVGIINTARGPLVDEDAISEALKSGEIGFYATDVLCIEGPNLNAPFLGHPNVIVTGHTGSRTNDSVAAHGTRAVENLKCAIAGGDALWVVPPPGSATVNSD